MSIFEYFKRKDPSDPPKEVRDMFKKLAREGEGRKLADKALSYRNVGNFNKAFDLLKRALTEFDYKPAITLIGTTYFVKGEIKNAVRWFEQQIKEGKETNDFPLIELYTNLGIIYLKSYENYPKALEIFIEALKAPRPDIVDEEIYSQMESNVYCKMAIAYSAIGDMVRSRQCAEKHQRVRPDCPFCREILDQGTSL